MLMQNLENRLDSVEPNVCEFYSGDLCWEGSNVDVGVAGGRMQQQVEL
jgi:hypothetical protein